MSLTHSMHKKTYKISKTYNRIHENLQVTYKVFEKNYLHSTEIIITHKYLQENPNIIRIQYLNFGTYDMKNLFIHNYVLKVSWS